MDGSTLRPGWIAAAGLTVLSCAAVVALTLTTAGRTTALPTAVAMVAEPVVAAQVTASDWTAPTPVSISLPAPAAASRPTAAPATAGPAATAQRVAVARRADPLCQGAGWQARRGAAAIDRLRRSSDARAVPIAFRGARSDVLGMAEPNARRIEVYVRSCAAQSDALLLHVVAHELGHLVDAIRMDDDLRARWKAARGIPASTPWFGCSRCRDFATPAGDFAETYAQWQRRATTNRSQLAPAPSRAQLAVLARTFFAPL